MPARSTMVPKDRPGQTWPKEQLARFRRGWQNSVASARPPPTQAELAERGRRGGLIAGGAGLLGGLAQG
jgi:hypothetical protein